MGRKAFSDGDKGRVELNEEAVEAASSAADVVAGDLAEVSAKYGLARYNRDSVAWSISSRVESVQEFAGRASYEIGALLLQARAAETKDGFATLLRTVNMSDRSARQHMQVAVRLGDNATAFSKLSFGKMLAITQEADDDVIAKLASGERVGDLDFDELDRLPREEIKKRLRKIERERDIWKAAADDADAKSKAKRKKVLTPEQEEAATACEEHSGYAAAINAAVLRMDAVWKRAVEAGMVNDYDTYTNLRRAVAIAKMALDALVERHSIDLSLDEPPADIFAPAPATE